MVAQIASFDSSDHVKAIDTFSLNKRVLCAVVICLADIFALGAVFGVAGALWSHDASPQQNWLFMSLGGLQIIAMLSLGHYFKRLPYWSEYRHILIFVCLAMFTHLLVGVYLQVTAFKWMCMWASVLIVAPVTRLAFRGLLRNADVWNIPTIIIGDGPNALAAAKSLFREKYLGYEVISFLSLEGKSKDALVLNGKSIPVRAINERIDIFLRRVGSPCIIIAVEKDAVPQLSQFADKIGLSYPSLIISPSLKGLSQLESSDQQLLIHEILMLEIKGNLNHLASRFLKRSFDLTGAISLIILSFPLLLMVTYLVRRSGKQVIFAHRRVGRGGKEFGCLKFRSMIPNAQEVLEDLLATDENARQEWEKEFKLKNDPRITRIGEFLRKTSLDELPQLWNVVKGEMSLVGPRPVVRDEILRYGKNAAFYYKAKPGITGLWQVSGRNDIDYESRIDLDVWYVQNWSMWKDLIILFRTFNVVLNRNGAY